MVDVTGNQKNKIDGRDKMSDNLTSKQASKQASKKERKKERKKEIGHWIYTKDF